ncbi:heavy metal efflux pump, CzcA family [Nitrosococcus halophilus Nc 4]|uniref:Heavy metal efflux pump, CzcA family n=1 Tax=Nitrosococcus halophilus (strain Nc4) TaxID=472759 RepID=D5C2X8_NITHN|nr:efflux RND transporter permease subunit [Nitrosococcus halophilus]ADE14870.1 heavy metal efflux pump, CzcA family [Nitrosococcus halophilus Nc 4]
MIAKIIQWSLKQRLLILLGAAALLVWGGVETGRMPVDVFPDLTAPRVTVVAEAHGMAPEEVETLITFPLETAFNGASGVRRVRSSSGVGIAVITIEFNWGMDIYRARQIVAEKLQLVRGALPPQIPPPVLAPVTSIMGEIMFVALTSDRHSALELKTKADWVLRRRLLAVPGVAQVIPIGGDTKQYQVIIQPERLAAYDIAVDQVVEALRKTNQNISAGFYVQGGQEYLIHGIGRVQRLEDIRETLIAQRGDQPVLVRHVAEVALGPAPKRGTGAHNGEAAVIIGIQKQPDTNTLALTARLDEVLAEIQTALPPGMILKTHIFRQADFITVAIENLLEALRDGAILVVVIVFAFLMSLRASVITLLAIPLSLVTAILAMKALGANFNTMTLGGMAIALGALVDDAIIVVENIVRRLRENQQREKEQRRSPGRVVLAATREIQGSIVFATLIIILVFLPLFFLSGVEGRLMQPLGLAYIISLAASLLVAITVTPVLSLLLLPRARIVHTYRETRLVGSLKRHYERFLAATVTRWKTIALMALIALAATLGAFAGVGQSFLPPFNEGSLTISAVTLPGTSLAQSDRLGQRVEKILLQYPEVVATARRTGRAELDPHAQAIYASEIDVSLSRGERSKEAFLADLRSDLAAVSGMQINIGQPISHRIDHMLSGTRANIAVKIFGPDLYELRRIGQQVKTVMEGIPGVVDLAMEQQADIPFLTIKFKRQAIARHGLQVQEVAEAVTTAFYGQSVSKILEGQSSFDLVVRYDPRVKADLEAVRATLITTPGGARLPLHALAEIRKDRGPNTISRENVQRKMVVMANVAERDLVGVVEEIQQSVRQGASLPAGYHIEYGGQFESAEAASRTLSILGVLVVFGIFLLLFMAFNSARDAGLVMVNLPLALMGGVIGVYLSGGILSVASLIGFITLFGIATRNGVMMIAHIHHLVEKEGVREPLTAVIRGARERLIPILMTALGTALALIPLALSAGEPGSEIQAPMAMVILFGLLTSTMLNMVVVPALYLRFGAVRQILYDRGA